MNATFWHPNIDHQKYKYDGYDGNLTKTQKGALDKMSQHFASFDLTPCMIPREARKTLFLRFLRARKFSAPKAIDMLTEAYEFKTKKINVMDLREMTAKDVLGCDEGKVNRYWPQYIHGTDRQGRLVAIFKAGLIDAKSLLKLVSIEKFTRYLVWRMELTRKLMAMNRERTGYFSESLLLIFDMTGFSISRYNREVQKCIQRFTEVLQNYYPESNGATFVINTVTLFKVVWSFASRLLDARTRRKISILSSDYADELHDVVSRKCLPRDLGGEQDKLELDEPLYYLTFEEAEDLISPARLKQIEDDYLAEEAERFREEEREREEEERRSEERRRAEEERQRREKLEQERILVMRMEEELRRESERERLEEERRQKELREAEMRRREIAMEERRKEKLRQKEKEEREREERIRMQAVMREAMLRRKEEERRREEEKERVSEMLRRKFEEEAEAKKQDEEREKERLRLEGVENDERKRRESALRKESRLLEAEKKRKKQQEEDAIRRSAMRQKWESDAIFQRDVQKWRDEVMSKASGNTKVMSLRMRTASLASLDSYAESPAPASPDSPPMLVNRKRLTLTERMEESGTTSGDTRIFANQKFVLRLDVAFHSEVVVQFLTSAGRIGFQILNNGSEVGDGLKICSGKYGQVSGAVVQVVPGVVHIRWDNSYRSNSGGVLEAETVKYVAEWKRVGVDDKPDLDLTTPRRRSSSRRQGSDSSSARSGRNRTSTPVTATRRQRRPSDDARIREKTPKRSDPLDGDDCIVS
eukprot:g1595.t1